MKVLLYLILNELKVLLYLIPEDSQYLSKEMLESVEDFSKFFQEEDANFRLEFHTGGGVHDRYARKEKYSYIKIMTNNGTFRYSRFGGFNEHQDVQGNPLK